MVNQMEGIWSKDGTFVSATSLASIFQTGSDTIGDPRIVYDNSSGRFFASIIDYSTASVNLAVSLTSKADSGWYRNTFPGVAGLCPDNDYLGYSSDKLILTDFLFNQGGPSTLPCYPLGGYADGEVFVIDKAALLSGGSFYYYYWYYSSWSGVRPVASDSSTAYVVCSTCGLGLELIEFSGIPTSTNSPTLTTTSIPFAVGANAPNAPVPGTSDVLETGDTVISSTFWNLNHIWLTLADGCIPGGDTAFRSCDRIVELGVSPAQVLANYDLHGPPGYYLLYPAIALDSFGDLSVVTGFTNSTAYPGLLVTGVKATESLSNLQNNLVIVQKGNGYFCNYFRSAGICRYGDYFGASSDPSDPALLWLSGEFLTATEWGTAIQSLRVGLISIAVRYTTQDGSAILGSPSLSYSQEGSAKSASLSSSPRLYYMDLGSAWSASQEIGASPSERWMSQSSFSATASNDANISIIYYHQYSVIPVSSISGGGGGYGPPTVGCTEFGSFVAASIGAPAWADAASPCSFSQTLAGSGSEERWAAPVLTFLVASSGQISANYFHQYLFALGYSLTGGGSPSPPTVSTTQFGAPTVEPLTTSTAGLWIDSGATWSVPAQLGSAGTGERWVSGGQTNGVASGPLTESIAYVHQFFITISLSPSVGGTVPVSSGWFNATSTLQLQATSESGWQFEGWSGTGPGSYTGPSAQDSLPISGAMNESATFFPGLTITSSGSGSITYAFGTTHGSVPAGQTATIYAPSGSTIVLNAEPSSILNSFSGWTGASAGSPSQASISPTGPSSLGASFAYNTPLIGGIVALLAVIIGLSLYAMRRRRGREGFSSPRPPVPARPTVEHPAPAPVPVKATATAPVQEPTNTAPTSPASTPARGGEPKFCRFCGSPLGEMSAYCEQCGRKL